MSAALTILQAEAGPVGSRCAVVDAYAIGISTARRRPVTGRFTLMGPRLGRSDASQDPCVDAPNEAVLRDSVVEMFMALEVHGALQLQFLCFVKRARATEGAGVAPAVSWGLSGALRIGAHRIPLALSGRGHDSVAPTLRSHSARTAELAPRVRLARPLARACVPTVLAAQPAAVVLHECVGHFAEADLATPLTHRLGVRVTSSLLSLADVPAAPGGKAAYCWDDEGTAARDRTSVLVEGVLLAQLHSLATARRDDAPPTGNGRAAGPFAKPQPRMSNLVCAPGATPEEALVGEMGEGLLVHRLAEGSSWGPTAQASIVLAERIARGRATGDFLAGGRLHVAAGGLMNVEAVGDRSVFVDSGLCGKNGQVLHDVGTCAPALRLSAMTFLEA